MEPAGGPGWPCSAAPRRRSAWAQAIAPRSLNHVKDRLVFYWQLVLGPRAQRPVGFLGVDRVSPELRAPIETDIRWTDSLLEGAPHRRSSPRASSIAPAAVFALRLRHPIDKAAQNLKARHLISEGPGSTAVDLRILKNRKTKKKKKKNKKQRGRPARMAA